MNPLPHEGVNTRLGRSAIHGIGVFAIADIPKGQVLFTRDRSDMVWVSREAIAEADPSEAHRGLYHDFGVARGGRVGVPSSFNNLTPGWYVNEPVRAEDANAAMNDDFEFVTLRDIAEGEEITAIYAGFSDPQA